MRLDEAVGNGKPGSRRPAERRLGMGHKRGAGRKWPLRPICHSRARSEKPGMAICRKMRCRNRERRINRRGLILASGKYGRQPIERFAWTWQRLNREHVFGRKEIAERACGRDPNGRTPPGIQHSRPTKKGSMSELSSRDFASIQEQYNFGTRR